MSGGHERPTYLNKRAALSWIINPRVPGSRRLGGSMVASISQLSKVHVLSTSITSRLGG